MSDFLMNLARRAVGDPAHLAEVAPSPHAALAGQMALPAVAAPEPAPPAITAVAPAATAPVMREVAQPPVSPPATAAPPAAAVQTPGAPVPTQPDIPAPSTSTPVAAVIPASIDREAAAVTVVPASPQDPDRSIDLSNAGPFRIEALRPLVPSPAAPLSKPSVEVPAEVVARIGPQMPSAEVSRVAPVSPTPDVPQALGPREDPRSRVQPPPATPVEPVRVERTPLERAPVVPRAERPPDALAPVAPPEPATSPATPDMTAAQRARPAVAAQRPVNVRIGAIEVQLTAPAPPAPSDRPSFPGFEEYAGVRNHVRYDGE